MNELGFAARVALLTQRTRSSLLEHGE